MARWLSLFLRGVGLQAGAPWCAAFIHHIGHWSQFDTERSTTAWPLPATGSCQLLGDFAAKHSVLVSHPWRGDACLLYSTSLGRFAHTGIVLDVRETASAFLCITIEGNTNDDGSRDGRKSCLKRRVFGKADGHVFIRWTNLLNALCDTTTMVSKTTLPNSAMAV